MAPRPTESLERTRLTVGRPVPQHPRAVARWIGGALTLTALAGACSTSGNTFRDYLPVPDSVDITGLRVQLVPVTVDPDIEQGDSVALVYEAEMERVLDSIGVRVVPSAAYRDIWVRINLDAGGFYDPFTGELDQARYDAAVDLLFDEIRREHAPDLLLFPEIWIVEVEHTGGAVEWAGHAEAVPELMSYQGTVYATSLVVVLEDLEGNELFVNGHGIRVQDRLMGPMIVTDTSPAFLLDSKTVHRAVREVIRPLAAGSGV